MVAFTSLRDRDAWSTIRGYVYQVDLTIQRWLGLLPSQILELECGEDIDIISLALIADEIAERDRLLEQVKHREGSLTLRSSEALTAVACFIEHIQSNPDNNLVFQFTTNAKVGRENYSPMPGKIPAIEGWNTLSEGILDGEHEEILSGIRQLLKHGRKPSTLQEDTWNAFLSFVQLASDQQLLEIVQKFHWRTQAPDAKSLKPLLKRKILERQGSTDAEHADRQYQRLFWYVFNRLSQQGKKQLTLTELTEQLSLPALTSDEQKTLDVLKVWADELDARVMRLEQGQDQNSQAIASLGLDLQSLANTFGIEGKLEYCTPSLVLDPQPLVSIHSRREETVERFTEMLDSSTWVAIDGSLGTGKTQLIALIVQQMTRRLTNMQCVWLRLRDLTTAQSCVRFDQAIETLVEQPFTVNLSTWLSDLHRYVDGNLVIVFDDLPQLFRGDELETRLIALAQVCNDIGIKILSSSSYELPSHIQSVLSPPILSLQKAPPFSNSEVTELLSAYGASKAFLSSIHPNYINGLAGANPCLLASIAEYLKRLNWSVDNEILFLLLRGEYAESINDETLGRLLAVLDTHSQELLYRLNLVTGRFSSEDMHALAGISPAVARPLQQFHRLTGLWVQRDVGNKFFVSPPVKALGSHDLSSDVRKECHLVLGDRIVSTDFNQYQAICAINHFVSAEQLNKAGALLISSLNILKDSIDLSESSSSIDDGGLLLLWSNQALPEQMDLYIRIMIRGFQIMLRVEYNLPVSYLLEDCDRLIDQATAKESAMLIGVVSNLVNNCPKQTGFSRLHQYFRKALSLAETPMLPDETELSFPEGTSFEALIWAFTGDIDSVSALEEWMSTVEQMSQQQKNNLFSARVAEMCSWLIADMLHRLEEAKPESERNWQSILIEVRAFAERALEAGLEILWACFVCSEISILSSSLGDAAQAVTASETALATASEDPTVVFLLCQCIGNQLDLESHSDQAIDFLTAAIEQPSTSYPNQRFYTFLTLSRAISSQEPRLSVQYTQQAVRLAKTSEEISEIEEFRALCEFAIAQWLVAGDVSSAFTAWDKAGNYLLDLRKDDDVWKEAFVLYSHTSAHFSALATTGAIFSGSDENGDTYTAPYRGVFLSRNAERVAYYNPERDSLLPAVLSSFAAALGEDERATTWAIKGIEMARSSQQMLALPRLILNVMPKLVLENDYDRAIDLSLEIGPIMAALSQVANLATNNSESNLSMQSITDRLGQSNHEIAESSALITGVLPIVFHIANMAISHLDEAKEKAAELSAICYEVADGAGDQSLWASVADMTREISLQQSTCSELVTQYQNIRSPDQILHIIGMMSASLQPGAPLQDVLSIHLAIIDKVQQLANPQPVVWRQIIQPYFFNYWKKSIELVMFRFYQPQEVVRKLSSIKTQPEKKQGSAILAVVQESLIPY